MTYLLQQLRIWQKNRDRKRCSTRRLANLLAASGISKKVGRLPQERELFSKRHYKTHIRPVTQAVTEHLEEGLGRKLTKKERLNTIKACTKNAYASASSEIQRSIKKEIETAKENIAAGRSGRILDIDARDRTPRQFQE